MLVAVEYFIKCGTKLDFILVETNGLADPSSVKKLINLYKKRQLNNFGLIQNSNTLLN